MSDFINGLIVKAPHPRAPEYVRAKLSLKREELIAWLQARTEEWINADIKVSQGGKWYAAVDDWRPGADRAAPSARAPATARPQYRAPSPPQPEGFEDDIPF